jgi:hypothetical protein
MKYRVFLVESERGWGQDYWTEDYNTYDEAKERIRSVNADNITDIAPEWYMQAQDRIEVIK